MIPSKSHDHSFFGTTTVGEKGQIVIPSEAREALRLTKGEKLLVFGFGGEMIALAKISDLEAFTSHLSTHLKKMKAILKKNKS